MVGGNWNANGSFTNSTGVDGLFATTNGNGGVYLFYTTGSGGTGANRIVRVTDAAGWNQNISIISSNVIYTTTATTSLKGLTFVPQQTPNTVELIPPPILTAQTGATVGSPFSVTNTPDIPNWRGSITLITVNGSVLPAGAYNTSQAGRIVFDPSQSALLQTSGTKTLAISAAGYSTNSVAQTLTAGSVAHLVITTQPTAPLGSGGPLTTQPVVKVEDLYGNVVTNIVNITAAAAQSTWTLGGTTTMATSAGSAIYSGLTAFSATATGGDTISFTYSGLSVTSSPAFNIPAPIQSTLGGVTLSAGKLMFTFSNTPSASFSVHATNDVTIPISNWPVIGPAVESPAASGHYQFTDSSPATNAARFYILTQP